MKGSFRVKEWSGNVKLLTNDAGKYAFLTNEDYHKLVHNGKIDDSSLMNRLKDNFFYYEGDKEVYLRSMIRSIQDSHSYLFCPTSLFILVITNRCNHRCIYCQANGNAKPADMDIITARKIIERIGQVPTKQVSIEFQGGEPLLNYKVLHDTICFANEYLTDKRVSFSLVSNLSLLTEEMADFFAEKNVSISTSLDGNQSLHNRNRPIIKGNSFESLKEGLAILRSRGIKVGAIQTTTKASLNKAKEIIETYIELGMDSIFLRPLTRIGAAARNWKEVGYTPDDYLSFYKDGLDYIVNLNKSGKLKIKENFASIFLSKLLEGRALNYMELRSPCGAGIGQLAFTAFGDVYTCDEGRMLAEAGDKAFCLGNVFKNDYNDWTENPICKAVCAASLLESIPLCCDCVYQPYCGVCPVLNYSLDGDIISMKPHNDRCRIHEGILDILFDYLYKNDAETIRVLSDWVKP